MRRARFYRLPALLAALALLATLLPVGAPAPAALAADPVFDFPVALAGSSAQGYSVAAADFNLDGAADLAVGYLGRPAQVFLSRGDGSGEFFAPFDLPGSPPDANTFGIAAGDLNGDGAPDLALANEQAPAQVFLNRNDASGRFQPPSALDDYTTTELIGSVPAGFLDRRFVSVALADLDDDGNLDIILGSSGSMSQVFRGNGDGTFALPEILVDSFGEPMFGVAAADFDGANGPDIVLGSLGGSTQIYLNNGTGIFGDVGGNPLVRGATIDSGRPTISLAAGDLNADGLPDLVLGSNSANDGGALPRPSVLLLNNPAAPGAFLAPRELPESDNRTTAALLGDVNGDGALDVLLVCNGLPGTQVFLNRADGTGALAAPTILVGSGKFSRGGALADLNGDGALDLAVANALETAQVFANRLKGSAISAGFLPPVPLTEVARATLSVQTGDLNGDGWLDAVLINDQFANSADPGPSLVLLNKADGKGAFEEPVEIAGSGQASRDGVLADFTGDGLLDLALVNNDRPFQLFANRADSPGAFAAPAEIAGSGGRSRAAAAGDVNGDGLPDLVVGYIDQPARVFLNNPAQPGTFLASTPVAGSIFATLAVALGDLDGDGDLDLVLGQYIAPSNSLPLLSQVFLNQGGTFGAPADLQGSNIATDGAALGDLDGDGDLDLVLAGYGNPSLVYRNDGAGGFGAPAPLAGSGDNSIGVGLGDFNGDGALDVALGNYQGQLSQIFLNRGNGTFAPPQSLAGSGKNTTRLAVGDFDGDGVVDLAMASTDQLSQLYLNAGVSGLGLPRPIAGSGLNSFLPAIGDLDNDGRLDLALANYAQPAQVFKGDGAGGLALPINLAGTGTLSATAVLLGDLDRDARLDLILVGRSGPAQILRNQGGMSFAAPADLSGSDGRSQSGAVGDLNADGWLDLVLTGTGVTAGGQTTPRPSQVFLNDGAGGFQAPVALRGSGRSSPAAAIGDLNGDGASDIVLAGYQTAGQIYLNEGSGNFAAVEPISLPGRTRNTQDIALADLNGDGAPDVVASNFKQPSQVFLNRADGSGTVADPVNILGSGGASNRVAAGDVNGDGWIDLVQTNALNQPGQLFLNRADGSGGFEVPRDIQGSDGALAVTVSGRTYGSGGPLGAALGDMNGDGRLDLVLGSGRGIQGSGGPLSLLYLNHLGAGAKLPNNPPLVAATRPGPTGDGGFPSAPLLNQGPTIAIPFRLADPEGDPVREVRASFSLDGGGSWREAKPAEGTATRDLPAPPEGAGYTFGWDVFASGFFGQAEQVVVRLVAVAGGERAPGAAVGPIQRASVSSTTFPFRALGTQVRVTQGGQPVAGAVVYKLGAQSSGDALPVGPQTDAPSFVTNGAGLLEGRGVLEPDDTLFALARVPTTDVYSDSYDLYSTNIVTSSTGVSGFKVTSPGVQTIEVSPEHPLALFNLQVSLEWDAHDDQAYLEQLRFDLRRASEYLFDATNGQAALGYVDIFHDKEDWNYAHIRVYASNRVRPNAALGGVVSEPLETQVTVDGEQRTVTYGSGQVKMGAVWSRFGNPNNSNLSDDWPRTLAHELGHYLFFLDDNYLRLNDQGQIEPEGGCPGLMGDPYASLDLRPDADWLPDCAATLANRTVGRSDWATVRSFYPALRAPGTAYSAGQGGPTRLPLAVTEINSVEPLTPTARLAVPIFYLEDQTGGRVLPGARGTGYLFQGGAGDAPDRITSLGRANLDQLLARGARVGDRVCFFEPGALRSGCETIAASDERLTIYADPDWRPDIQVTPVATDALRIELRTLDAAGAPLQLPLQSVTARIYPAENQIDVPAITLPPVPGAVGHYSATLQLAEPVLEGYVHITAGPSSPAREAVGNFAIGGNPGNVNIASGLKRSGGGLKRSGGGLKRSGGGLKRSGGGLIRVAGAPVASAEGDVLLLADDLTFPEGALVTLQSVSELPAPPSWAKAFGVGYRLSVSGDAPDLRGTPISFGYQGSDVAEGDEEGIRVYFLAPGESAWRPLATAVDTYHNLAAAENQGPGLYALMSSVTLKLQGPGWNLVGYPVRATRTVTEALASIAGSYDAVYGFEYSDTGGAWLRYFPGQPPYVNNLETMAFGKGYWIRTTRPTAELPDLLLRGADASAQVSTAGASATADGPAQPPTLPAPPATYFGGVRAAAGFTPEAGQAVEALVGGQVCGSGRTLAYGGKIVYVVDVRAADDGAPACGLVGRAVSFRVGSRPMLTTAAWAGGGAQALDLAAPHEVIDRLQYTYLPIVRR